jgi:glycerophosphoryl diester phosphodiesterase
MHRKFELQGHRGARALFPENTIAGFVATMAIGVDALELDVAVTADNVPVVCHNVDLDPDVTRDATGAWITSPPPLVRSLTLAQLRAYDVGRIKPASVTEGRFPDQHPYDGTGIPTLAEVFAATAPVWIHAELKTLPTRPDATVSAIAMAELVMDCARDAGALDRLDIRSFDFRGLRHMRAAYPEIPLTYLTGPGSLAQPALFWDGVTPDDFGGSVPRVIAAEASGRRAVWAPHLATFTQADLVEAQALGLRVIPWTVNDPADMARFIAWGADGLCTDRPDLALAAMQDAGLALPNPA